MNPIPIAGILVGLIAAWHYSIVLGIICTTIVIALFIFLYWLIKTPRYPEKEFRDKKDI